MTPPIKVSVIVPVFNTAKYLSQCFDSLINQSLKDMEFIFVDNGSTDGSLELLQQLVSKHEATNTYLHQVTGGRQGRCRNFGIRQASGTYVGFCDSDDWCDPVMFEKLYTKATKFNSDICFGRVICSDTTTKKQHDHYEAKYFKDGIYNTYEKPYLTRITSSCNKIYSRSLLLDNHVTFIEGIVHQDVTFNYQALFHGKNICADVNAIYYYRQHAASTTKTLNKVVSKPSEDVMQMIKELRRLEGTLGYKEEWHTASNRIIESHITHLMRGVETAHIKHYLEKVLEVSGYLPYNVFLKLKNNTRREIIGQELHSYFEALRRFQPENNRKLDKYRYNFKNLACFTLLSLLLNIWFLF